MSGFVDPYCVDLADSRGPDPVQLLVPQLTAGPRGLTIRVIIVDLLTPLRN